MVAMVIIIGGPFYPEKKYDRGKKAHLKKGQLSPLISIIYVKLYLHTIEGISSG